jgi:prepilin-type processing-associated H-X9-DG protein
MSIIESIRHPGDAEAHAAGVAMADLYGSPAQGEGRWVNGRLVSTYAVGDSVNVAFPDGHRRCVVVEVLTDTTYHVVHHKPGGGREHYAIDVDAIAAF